jgi:hypothetical protein
MARPGTATKTLGSAARGRASGRSADAPWGPTEIQRDYRTLLDRAKDAPQEVLDSDGEVLVIQTKGVADFQRHLQAQVAETARFVAIFNEHREVLPPEWAMQTAYPWLAAFSSDEVEEFARELVADTFDGQADAMRALLSQVDLDGIVEVLPPSEGQVRAAQA